MADPSPSLVERAISLALQATNGWAANAKRNIEHNDIARLHREIDELREAASRLSSPEGTRGDFDIDWEALSNSPSSAPAAAHDMQCESELTSHGYTPCRCVERAASPRVSAATPVPSAGFDYQRVFDWACNPKRQRANIAFTEGIERNVADLIEDVMVNVSAAERPAQTCATCKFAKNVPHPGAVHPLICVNGRDFGAGTLVPTFDRRVSIHYGCTLHEPAPPGQIAQE